MLTLSNALLAAHLLLATPPAEVQKVIHHPRPVSDFAFLKPGTTTLTETEATLGDRKWGYKSWLVEGDLQIEPWKENVVDAHARAEYQKREVIAVDVRVYTTGPEGLQSAWLVFHEGVLLYASVPVSLSESTREKVVARLGREPVVYKETPNLPGITVKYSSHLLVFPGESVFYFEALHGAVQYKVLHRPGLKPFYYELGDVRPAPSAP